MGINIIQITRDLISAHGIDTVLLKPPFDRAAWDNGAPGRLLHREFPKRLDEICHESVLYMNQDSFGVHFAVFKLPPDARAGKEVEFFIIGPYQSDSNGHITDVTCGIPVIADVPALESQIVMLAKYIFGGEDHFAVEWFDELIHETLDTYSGHHEHDNTPDSFSPEAAEAVIEERFNRENMFLDAVAEGNYEKAAICYHSLRKYWKMPKGEKKAPDPKGYLIVLNTLLRRAAQQAEMHPKHIDHVSESFIGRIESAGRTSELKNLRNIMIKTYCSMIKNYALCGYSPLIQRVISYIEFNLAGPLSLSELSEKNYISPGYLSAQFRKETGQTITSYIRMKRVKSSLSLLSKTNLPVWEVAEKVGIADESYFTKLFKSIQDMTPSDYRGVTRVRVEWSA
jgi:AraC-like DNA-binding protein